MIFLLTILFTDYDEATFFYHELYKQSITTFQYMTVKQISDMSIYIQCEEHTQICIRESIIPLLVSVFLKVKGKKIISRILEEKFYYTNEEEKSQILCYAYDVIEEGHPML